MKVFVHALTGYNQINKENEILEVSIEVHNERVKLNHFYGIFTPVYGVDESLIKEFNFPHKPVYSPNDPISFKEFIAEFNHWVNENRQENEPIELITYYRDVQKLVRIDFNKLHIVFNKTNKNMTNAMLEHFGEERPSHRTEERLRDLVKMYYKVYEDFNWQESEDETIISNNPLI